MQYVWSGGAIFDVAHVGRRIRLVDSSEKILVKDRNGRNRLSLKLCSV